MITELDSVLRTVSHLSIRGLLRGDDMTEGLWQCSALLHITYNPVIPTTSAPSGTEIRSSSTNISSEE